MTDDEHDGDELVTTSPAKALPPSGGITFLAAELGRWDQQGDSGQLPETLVLPFFSDERPLRGAAGLCDFRLCGRLSRLLLRQRVLGELAEATLYPPGAQLPFSRLLLFGLGPQAAFDEGTARRAGRRIIEVADRLGLRRYAIVLPGRSTGRLSARQALSLFLAESDAGRSFQELVVVESTAGQKEAADLARIGSR